MTYLPIIRSALFASAALTCLALAPAATAQVTATDADDATSIDEGGGEEIVVSGIRGSLNQSLDVKRQSRSIVDAISSEDVGKFPDTNIAESVQRITGVQINRSRGEGRTVNIRGLPSNFTLVTFNGRTLPNALYGSSDTRSFDFSLLPSEFVHTLEVFKSPSAETEDGGLSGVVNVKTPRALALGKRVLTLSAEAQFESNSAKIGPKASAFYANTFLDGRLGLTLGGAYSRRKPETHQNEVNYTTITEGAGLRSSGPADLNGDGLIEPGRRVRIPDSVFYTIYQEDIERVSGIGSLEFEATDALTFTLDSFYSKLRVRSTRIPNNNQFYGAGSVISAKTEMIGGIETATEFEVAGLDVRNNGRLEDSDGHIWSTNLGARFESGGWTADLSGAYSRSRQTLNTLNIANIVLVQGRFTARPGDRVSSVDYTNGSDALFADPNNARILNLNGAYDLLSTDRQYEARFDASYEIPGGGFLSGLAFGAKYVDREKYQDNWLLSITPAGVSDLYGGLPAGPIPGSVSAAPVLGGIKAGSGTFLGSYSGDATFPTAWLTPDTRSLVYGLTKDELLAAGRYTNDAVGITNVKEKTLAFYGRADFESGPITGNLGLRAVRTSQRTVGISPDLSGITYEIGGGLTRVPGADLLAVSRSYWDILPSFNLKFEAANDLVVRVGASRTMARPELGQISPTTIADGNDRIITENNPYLAPFRSNNLDASVEWYFNRSSLLGVSLFFKDIKSLVRRESTLVDLPVTYVWPDGSSTVSLLEFRRSGLVNGKGVTVKGAEFSYQQAFTGLPAPFDGLGTILNYTYIDNGDPQQLTAASKHNFNAVAYYEKGPIGLRLSYSWRSEFLSEVAEAPLMSQRTRAFGTLDASLNVQVAKDASIILQGVNLTDADEARTYDTGLPAYYMDSGRRFSIGARVQF